MLKAVDELARHLRGRPLRDAFGAVARLQEFQLRSFAALRTVHGALPSERSMPEGLSPETAENGWLVRTPMARYRALHDSSRRMSSDDRQWLIDHLQRLDELLRRFESKAFAR